MADEARDVVTGIHYPLERTTGRQTLKKIHGDFTMKELKKTLYIQ
nr:hypothetical protein [Escherichia coli]